jgi:hypothetical protein
VDPSFLPVTGFLRLSKFPAQYSLLRNFYLLTQIETYSVKKEGSFIVDHPPLLNIPPLLVNRAGSLIGIITII